MPGITVSARIRAGLSVTRTNDLADGFSAGNLAIKLPSQLVSGVRLAGGDLTIPASKAWAAVLNLAASTPITLDLTALTGGAGDTAFTSVALIDVRSLETPGSGRTLRIGGAGGATEWYDPLGASGDKITLDPGTFLNKITLETAGWSVGARKLLKLDPGANAHALSIVLVGA